MVQGVRFPYVLVVALVDVRPLGEKEEKEMLRLAVNRIDRA
jgi:hypothetical protein